VYKIYIERAAERDLKKLLAKDFNYIISHIKDLAKDPRPPGCRKIIGAKNDWRIRIGDYRVIYEINEKTETVNVMRVRHRREAYRQ
jgi:mRNA interferase RelE/StbE